MQSVKVGKNQAGQRLDKFLHKYLPNAGNGFLYKMLRKKNITLNGKKAEGSEKLVEGDEISIFFSDETFALFSGRSAAEAPGAGASGGSAAGASGAGAAGGSTAGAPGAGAAGGSAAGASGAGASGGSVAGASGAGTSGGSAAGRGTAGVFGAGAGGENASAGSRREESGEMPARKSRIIMNTPSGPGRRGRESAPAGGAEAFREGAAARSRRPVQERTPAVDSRAAREGAPAGSRRIAQNASAGPARTAHGGASLGNRQTGTEEYRAAYARLKGITVIYEDEDCLILNKPAGILAQKAAAEDRSINEWMIGYLLAESPSLEEELPFFKPGVCNRLDRNTSGIVLGGKSLAGLQYLSQCLRERTLRKFYWAVCAGELRGVQTVEGYLTKDADRNHVEITSRPTEGSSYVRTVYTPLAAAGGYTLLEVELITGKAHQIRAHLAEMGYPLAGDYKYGDETVNRFFKKEYGLSHQLLHACRVEFPEALSGPGEKLSGRSVSAPCPAVFERIRRGLGLQ